MKARPLVDSFLASSMPTYGMTLDQQIQMRKVKLLSSKGCDKVVYTEDEREMSKSLTMAEQAFYKSLPEWNEEHYDLSARGSLRSQEYGEE